MYLTRIAGIETAIRLAAAHPHRAMYLTRIAGIETSCLGCDLLYRLMYLTRIAGIETIIKLSFLFCCIPDVSYPHSGN